MDQANRNVKRETNCYRLSSDWTGKNVWVWATIEHNIKNKLHLHKKDHMNEYFKPHINNNKALAKWNTSKEEEAEEYNALGDGNIATVRKILSSMMSRIEMNLWE